MKKLLRCSKKQQMLRILRLNASQGGAKKRQNNGICLWIAGKRKL